MRSHNLALSAVAAVLIVPAAALAQRLPAGIAPTHYTLWFAPDLERATFQGRETIDITVQRSTTTLTVNAAELEFGEVTIDAAGRSQTARVGLDEKNETATFTVPQPIPAGSAAIHVIYTGILNDKLRGFYLSQANGRRYAITQMEATDARRAFPSWDEPAYKATYDVSLMINRDDTAIANGAQVSDTPGPETGKHTLVFARTKPISSYLVAMLVGDFECRSGAVGAVPVRVCSTPDKLPLTAFALDAAEHALSFFNDWTGIPYPFGKLDIIGVPDFSAGAMENIGAITFREEELLADGQRASIGTRKEIASVVSHEIAHQWFGDLVTMKWWDDIWLNEGFATWMANKPLAAWHPEWQVDLDEVGEMQTAIRTDALRSTRAIRTGVESPDEINEVFDPIAYEKTASVLRTLENYAGPDLFRKGVGSYLRKYSFANATGDDFWNEVARATGTPVDRIMRPFIEQPGVPVVKIEAQCLGSGTSVKLHQDRFASLGNPPSSGSQLWVIPVCFKTPGASPPECTLLDRRDQVASLPACAANAFGNANGRGYYLSDYPADKAVALAQARSALSPAERLTLLGDEWWMTRSGRHDIGVYFDVASAHASDPTPSIAGQIGRSLRTAHDAIVPPSNVAGFEDWVRLRFGPELTSLGVPGPAADSDDRQSRRAALLMLVGVTGNAPDVQREARDLAMKYVAEPASIPPTLASTLLSVAAYKGDTPLYDRYVATLPTLTGRPEEYYRLFNALAWFQDPALVQRTLRFAISPQVRTQDTASLIGGLLSRPTSQDAAWTFVKENWNTLTKSLGIFQGIPRVVGATGAFCSREKQADVEQFFKAHPVPAAERTLRQAFESIDSCIAVKERQAPAAAAWLASAMH